jgi:dihydrofolate reductase
VGKVVVALSVSLDGFIAGPNDGPSNPLGDGGSKLFEWWTAGDEPLGGDGRFKPPPRSRAVVEEMFGCGAIITGRRTFDIAHGWGGQYPVGVPFFLVTHKYPDHYVGP